jgi:hypothetical protein
MFAKKHLVPTRLNFRDNGCLVSPWSSQQLGKYLAHRLY